MGTDYMNWLNRNGYDKKTIAGFLYVKADYPTESALIDGTLTLTYWYSGKGTANIGVGSSGTTNTENSGGLTFDDIPEESVSYTKVGTTRLFLRWAMCKRISRLPLALLVR